MSGRFVLHGPLVRRAVIPMPTLANAPKMARLVPAAVACCLVLLCVRGVSAATECSFCVDHPESCDTPGQYCPSSLAYPKKCEVWRKVCMAAASVWCLTPTCNVAGGLLLPDTGSAYHLPRRILLS